MRLNNAVRGAAAAAMGSLQLFSPDLSARRKAAEAVFVSRDPAAIPALDRALAAGQPAGIRAVMQQARAAAALTATTTSDADRLAAIDTLRRRGDLAARSLLASLPPQPAAVAPAVAAALAAIDRSERLWGLAQDVFYGLSLGSVLLLAAAGLAITFGVMGVINMAHGEIVMLGAYTTYVVQQAIAAVAPGLSGASLFFAVPLAFLRLGAGRHRHRALLIRFLYGRPLETLLATWGVSLVLAAGGALAVRRGEPSVVHTGLDERRDCNGAG